MTPRELAALAVVAVISLSGCSSEDKPMKVPAVTSPSSPVQVIDGPPTAGILARLMGRTGQWQASFGKPGEQGALTVRYRCTGGGKITVGTSDGAETVEAKSNCDGVPRLLSGEPVGASAGTVTVTVEPDGAQRWSLLVLQGPINTSDGWPKDAPEIEPGG